MRYKLKDTSDESWLEFCVDKTLEEITEHFKVAKSSARTRCSILGIKLRLDKKEKYPGIEEYARTHTIKECALFYNSKYSTIAQYLKAHDIKYKLELTTKGVERVITKRTGTAHDMIVILCDYYSMASIAKVFGYSKERVRQIYHEAKVKNNLLLLNKVKENAERKEKIKHRNCINCSNHGKQFEVMKLKEQIEKMKKNCLDVMRVQGINLTDDYMAGMYNGMVVIYNSCFLDTVNELEKSYCSKNENGKWEKAE